MWRKASHGVRDTLAGSSDLVRTYIGHTRITVVYWGCIGIMENKMETTIMHTT